MPVTGISRVLGQFPVQGRAADGGSEGGAPQAPDPAAMPLETVERELRTLAGQIAAAECRFLSLLADFDAREGWGLTGVRSCAHWLSWQCGMDLRTARQYVQVARALPGLPLLREEFAAGRLSYSKVRAVARVGTPDNEADLVHAALRAPAALIERLTRGMKTVLDNGFDPTDPSTRYKNKEKDQAAKERAARERLGIRWHWDDDGTLAVWGRLSGDDGARLLAAAVRAESERRRTEQPLRPVAIAPSNMGPAVVAMAEMICAGLPAPTHAPGADVIVSVDADTFFAALTQPADDDQESAAQTATTASDGTATACCDHHCKASRPPTSGAGPEFQVHPEPGADLPGSDPAPGPDPGQSRPEDPQAGQGFSSRTTSREPAQASAEGASRPVARTVARPAWQKGAHIQDGPAVTAATLRRLADDGRLRTEVIAGDGRTLNLGRARRTVSDRQFLVLWRRDGGCTVPGCGRTRFLHAHHVVFWAQGGRTDLDNLLMLCGEHHRALHEGAFSITAHGHQQFTFHTRTGGPYQAAPPIRGLLDDLTAAHPDITDQTIVPDWDGSHLHLSYAVGSYLENWAARCQQSAA